MDCSKTENYFKEKARMTGIAKNGVNCDIECSKCPLCSDNNSLGVDCVSFELLCNQEAIKIVQKWSDEHSRKTVLQDFLEKYPDAPLEKDMPTVCPLSLGYVQKHKCDNNCIECWNSTLEEK